MSGVAANTYMKDMNYNGAASKEGRGKNFTSFLT